MIQYYSINGEIVPSSSAVIKINDLSILRSYAMFDFFLFKEGYPYFFEDYLARFENSAKNLNLAIPFPIADIKSQILRLIQANGIEEGAIRLVLTGGYSEDGYTPSTPNFLILQHSTPTYPPEAFENGVKLLLHEHMRTFPEIKTTNYIVGINRLKEIEEANALDLLFHHEGNIYETTRANFFILTQEDVLVTPINSVLKGVTRKQVLALAKKHYTIEERILKLEELQNAREAFITSSTKGPMPIVQVSDFVIGDAKVGPVTMDLIAKFAQLQEDYIKSKVGDSVSSPV